MTDAPVAIVTGGSRGIGLAIVRTLLERGYRVTSTSRSDAKLQASSDELGAGEALLTIAGHAADPEHRRAAVQATLERWGRIDVLVSNVGINPVLGHLVDLDLEVVRKVYDTNVVAALGWVQEVHRAWMAEHGGSIVTIASVTGMRTVLGILE